MLIDTFVYSLSFTSALPLLFRSVLSTERLEKVTLLSKENLWIYENLTELKDKHIFIFFQRKATRAQAASQFESCTEMASM